MPNHNTNKDFFYSAIVSVTKQKGVDWKFFEVVVVNDHCNKECKKNIIKIVNEIKIRLPELEISVIDNKQTVGPGNAINEGVKHSSGLYFASLDCDDILTANCLKCFLSYSKKYNHFDLLFSDHVKTSTDLKEIIYIRKKKIIYQLHKNYKNSIYDPHLYMSIIGHISFIKKSAWKQTGGYNNICPSEDWNFFLRISRLKKEVNFFHIPRILYKYRYNYKSVSNREVKKARKYIEDKHGQFLIKNHYSISKVAFYSRINPSHSSYYNLYRDQKIIFPPWFNYAKKTIIKR